MTESHTYLNYVHSNNALVTNYYQSGKACVGVLWYNAGSTRCLDNMISFLMHIPYIIENFVKIYKPSCMHPHRYYHSAEVCKSLVMLFILFLTYVFSLYY